MSVPIPCVVCSAAVPVLRFHNRRQRALEAVVTVGGGARVALAMRAPADIRVLCEAHHAVWESSLLAQVWLVEECQLTRLAFTERQFERFARGCGMSALALKKRLLRDAEDRAKAERRKRGRHDWATKHARALLFAETPYAKYVLMGAVMNLGVYGILNVLGRAA